MLGTPVTLVTLCDQLEYFCATIGPRPQEVLAMALLLPGGRLGGLGGSVGGVDGNVEGA